MPHTPDRLKGFYNYSGLSKPKSTLSGLFNLFPKKFDPYKSGYAKPSDLKTPLTPLDLWG